MRGAIPHLHGMSSYHTQWQLYFCLNTSSPSYNRLCIVPGLLNFVTAFSPAVVFVRSTRFLPKKTATSSLHVFNCSF
jgi:hypothetical protein